MKIKNSKIQLYFIYPLVFITASAILLGVYALRGVYPFGQGSVLALDLNAQYVYYYEFFRDVFYNNGTILYSFSRTLGGEMIGTFAYYLASPFSFILLLFPKEYITEAVLGMILAKVGAAAVTFALYLTISRKAKPLTAGLFSLMYALMSYIVVQTLNPMWLDGPIFFPLIILAVERFVYSGRAGLLITFLALMFMANFYIGYMVGFFTFIYFVYYYFNHGNQSTWKHPGRAYLAFFGASLLAAGAAMWLILPTYFSLKMGKLSFSEPVFTPIQRLDIFDIFSKTLPLVYDSVNVQGFPFIYCSFFAIVLLVIYFFSPDLSDRKKYSAAVLLAFFFTLFTVSTLDIVLHGFQEPVWLNYRYSFIISFFILVLAYESFTTMQISDPGKIIKICLLMFLATALIGRAQYDYIIAERTLWISYILLIIYGLTVYVLKNKDFRQVVPTKKVAGISWHFRNAVGLILVLVVVLELFFNAVTLINGAHNEVYYSDRSSYRDYFDRLYPHVEYLEGYDDGFYRTETVIRRTVNDPMALGIYGVSHSSSILNSNVINLLYRLGLASREHWTRYKGTTPLTDSIFGIRYIISETEVSDLYQPVYMENDLILYHNPYAMPVAFTIKGDLKSLELNSVDPFINQNELLNTLFGNSDREYFKLITIEEVVFENMTGVEHEGLVIYEPIDANQNAHIEYLLQPVGNHDMYMYLVSDYPRKVNIWVEQQYLDTFFDYSSTCIMPLGSHPDRERLSIITTPIDGEYYLNHNMFYYLDTDLFLETMEEFHANNKTEVKQISERKLQVTTDANEGDILFTTIPYDAGWRAKTGDRNVATFPVLNSLLAIKLEQGEQVIDLIYYPQGFFTGLTISTLSVILLGVILVIEKKRKRKGVEPNE